MRPQNVWKFNKQWKSGVNEKSSSRQTAIQTCIYLHVVSLKTSLIYKYFPQVLIDFFNLHPKSKFQQLTLSGLLFANDHFQLLSLIYVFAK